MAKKFHIRNDEKYVSDEFSESESVDGCMSSCGPMMDWEPVQGVALQTPVILHWTLQV